jgi:hypothetical protein
MMAMRAFVPPARSMKRSRISPPGSVSSAPPIGITGPWAARRLGVEATGADNVSSSLT